MTPHPPERRHLALHPATAEALEPFGQILGRAAGAALTASPFYGSAVKTSHPVDFQSDETTELTLCRLDRRPFEVRYMERHFLHTQTFIPLGGKPFIAVLAPPTAGELPDLDEVRAFRFDGTAGLTLRKGTWHEFPFAEEDGTDLIVVLRRDTMRDLKADRVKRSDYGDEARGPDLDKKNLAARSGILFTIKC